MKAHAYLFVALVSCLQEAGAGVTYPDGNKKAVIFSFDDGLEQDKKLVELLNQYSLVGTFNLSSGLFSQNALWLKDFLGETSRYVARENVASLYVKHEIASHSHTHPVLPNLKHNDVKYQVEKDKSLLSELVSYPVVSFAYPLGAYDDATIEVIKAAGFTNARTVQSTNSFTLPSNLFEWHPTVHHSQALTLANEYVDLNSDELTVFMVWGHSWEFDQNLPKNNWDYFEAVLQALAGKDDIWYTSAGEFARFYNAK